MFFLANQNLEKKIEALLPQLDEDLKELNSLKEMEGYNRQTRDKILDAQERKIYEGLYIFPLKQEIRRFEKKVNPQLDELEQHLEYKLKFHNDLLNIAPKLFELDEMKKDEQRLENFFPHEKELQNDAIERGKKLFEGASPQGEVDVKRHERDGYNVRAHTRSWPER